MADDKDAAIDVYLRDAGVTTLISDRVQAGPDGANPAAFRGASSDGKRVFFVTAEPLVAEDGDAAFDVYRRTAASTTA